MFFLVVFCSYKSGAQYVNTDELVVVPGYPMLEGIRVIVKMEILGIDRYIDIVVAADAIKGIPPLYGIVGVGGV